MLRRKWQPGLPPAPREAAKPLGLACLGERAVLLPGRCGDAAGGALSPAF